MILSTNELLQKYSFLSKYQNSAWFVNLSSGDPLLIENALYEMSKMVIQDIIDFTEATKFTSTWELCFSVKHRLLQIQQLINHFEQTKKNSQLSSCEDKDQISY